MDETTGNCRNVEKIGLKNNKIIILLSHKEKLKISYLLNIKYEIYNKI